MASRSLYTEIDVLVTGSGSLLENPWSTGGGMTAEKWNRLVGDDEESQTLRGSRMVDRGQTVLLRYQHFNIPSIVTVRNFFGSISVTKIE